MSISLLIVDDDKLTRDTLADAFADDYEVATANDGNEALAILAAQPRDIVLSDITMPGLDGLGLLERLNAQEERPAVIFITGLASVDSAVRAMKLGAHDYVTKPVNLERLALLMQKALEARALRNENTRLKFSLRESRSAIRIVGRSAAMEKVVATATRVAGTDASVLIEGESGTGKELVASLIHAESARSDGPLIKVNCAAFAEGVLESELFGHERGAFTGASATRKGRFEMADHGTLFLDEIGDLPQSAQVKLLRFLQERTFERVGGGVTFKVDVRVIAATHRNLAEMIKTGDFREDLYYRLRVVLITVPPLRERNGDIDDLIDHLLEHYRMIHGRPVDSMTMELRELLRAHNWPGNIRELMNCIESLVVMAGGPQIGVEDLPEHLLEMCEKSRAGSAAGDRLMDDLERRTIVEVLKRTSGNKAEAARILGIGLRTLYRKIDKWGL
ncbi:MAG: sigma-54 dependent transcriptional regulator [Burkholderiaceae bacterium]|nr:sigma-54 dependent transcriptional regulator [Burkholderiaceae bacterium]